MTVFGKPLSAYARFAKLGLAVVAAVTLLRLILSLAGVDNDAAKWVSGTAAALAAALVYSARVHTKGFGSYKQVLPVVWLIAMTLSVLVALAVMLGIVTGQDNIFTAPEYSGGQDGKNWVHVFAHIVVGAVILPLVLWGLGSLVLLVTKAVAPRPGSTRAAA
ncbi:MAG TPA: hypothetical protein VFO85_04950 [Vicinamibacteria bacterium]|nr:hypothetical protein [Vicinamibacteria bacterium]